MASGILCKVAMAKQQHFNYLLQSGSVFESPSSNESEKEAFSDRSGVHS